MATEIDEASGYGRNGDLLRAIEVDLNSFGVSFSEDADLDDILAVVKSLMPTHDFDTVDREVDFLIGLLVKRVVSELEETEFSPQTAEEEVLDDNWRLYKYTAQTNGRHLERFEGLQGLVRSCVALAEDMLSPTEKRLLSSFGLADPDRDDEGPFAISELVIPRVADLARNEKIEVCDEAGRPLWMLLPTERRVVDTLLGFLLELVGPEHDPPALCELALAISFLRKLPRQTDTHFNLVFRNRTDGESRFASMCGNWSELTLESGGSVDSGFGHDSYSNTEFQRSCTGRGSGSDSDAYRWIDLARELLASGGHIGSDGSAFEDIGWDDGESEIYWTMLGLET